jgi:hypothetical protein
VLDTFVEMHPRIVEKTFNHAHFVVKKMQIY